MSALSERPANAVVGTAVTLLALHAWTSASQGGQDGRAAGAAPRRAGPGDRVSGWVGDRLPDALRGRVALSGQHGAVVLALLSPAFWRR